MHTKEEREGILWEFHRSDLSAPAACRSLPLFPNKDNLHAWLKLEEAGALVVVDQLRNIGSLALSRTKLAGMPHAYLPGLAAHGASKLFAGDAKTDERGAMVIVKTALAYPTRCLRWPTGRPR